MGQFDNYSFSNVNVIFGVEEIQGYFEGDDIVVIEPEADQFNDSAGAKGDVVRSQTNDNRCTITVKLLQVSLSNDILKAKYNADKVSGSGVEPMLIQDKDTGDTYVVDNAWIQRIPTITLGQGVNSMDWVFRGDNFRALT